MYLESSPLGASLSFYAAVFILVFIAIVLIYLPALFRYFGGNDQKNTHSLKERKGNFQFSVVNVFVLLVLAVVFAVLAHHQH